jgi:hypothetical protein
MMPPWFTQIINTSEADLLQNLGVDVAKFNVPSQSQSNPLLTGFPISLLTDRISPDMKSNL